MDAPDEMLAESHYFANHLSWHVREDAEWYGAFRLEVASVAAELAFEQTQE
jgi:hypothetical protein